MRPPQQGVAHHLSSSAYVASSVAGAGSTLMVGFAIVDWVVAEMKKRNKSSATNLKDHLQEGVHPDGCLAASRPETLTRLRLRP